MGPLTWQSLSHLEIGQIGRGFSPLVFLLKDNPLPEPLSPYSPTAGSQNLARACLDSMKTSTYQNQICYYAKLSDPSWGLSCPEVHSRKS